MATTLDVHQQLASLVLAAVFVLTTAAMPGSIVADDQPTKAEEPSASEKVIDKVADQILQYCDAHKVTTLQLVEFRGTLGPLSQSEVQQSWVDSLVKRGIAIRETDSTQMHGKVVTQQSEEASVVLFQCTLTDSRGAVLRTFRVREILAN